MHSTRRYIHSKSHNSCQYFSYGRYKLPTHDLYNLFVTNLLNFCTLNSRSETRAGTISLSSIQPDQHQLHPLTFALSSSYETPPISESPSTQQSPAAPYGTRTSTRSTPDRLLHCLKFLKNTM